MKVYFKTASQSLQLKILQITYDFFFQEKNSYIFFHLVNFLKKSHKKHSQYVLEKF